jgi:hypothetical protein
MITFMMMIMMIFVFAETTITPIIIATIITNMAMVTATMLDLIQEILTVIVLYPELLLAIELVQNLIQNIIRAVRLLPLIILAQVAVPAIVLAQELTPVIDLVTDLLQNIVPFIVLAQELTQVISLVPDFLPVIFIAQTTAVHGICRLYQIDVQQLKRHTCQHEHKRAEHQTTNDIPFHYHASFLQEYFH